MKQRARGAGRVLQDLLGGIECNTACQQLLPGVGSETHALRPHGQIDSTGIPEACFRVHEPVMGSANERRDLDSLAIRRQRIVLHFADTHAAI